MPWWTAVAALISAPVPLGVDAQRQEIPPAYQGLWVLTPATCQNALEQDKVAIEGRRISFYESDAFLELGQLNDISDPPQFHGKFNMAGELSFWEGVIRLEMDGRYLRISNIKAKDEDASPERWVRCPS